MSLFQDIFFISNSFFDVCFAQNLLNINWLSFISTDGMVLAHVKSWPIIRHSNTNPVWTVSIADLDLINFIKL